MLRDQVCRLEVAKGIHDIGTAIPRYCHCMPLANLPKVRLRRDLHSSEQICNFKISEWSPYLFHKERVWSRGPPWTQICVLFLLLNCNILFESLQIHSEVFREFYKGHPYFNLLDSTINILLYVLHNISIPLTILFSSWISKWTVDIRILLHKPCFMPIITEVWYLFIAFGPFD